MLEKLKLKTSRQKSQKDSELTTGLFSFENLDWIDSDPLTESPVGSDGNAKNPEESSTAKEDSSKTVVSASSTQRLMKKAAKYIASGKSFPVLIHPKAPEGLQEAVTAHLSQLDSYREQLAASAFPDSLEKQVIAIKGWPEDYARAKANKNKWTTGSFSKDMLQDSPEMEEYAAIEAFAYETGINILVAGFGTEDETLEYIPFNDVEYGSSTYIKSYDLKKDEVFLLGLDLYSEVTSRIESASSHR
jgi:hypothetical protein